MTIIYYQMLEDVVTQTGFKYRKDEIYTEEEFIEGGGLLLDDLINQGKCKLFETVQHSRPPLSKEMERQVIKDAFKLVHGKPTETDISYPGRKNTPSQIDRRIDKIQRIKDAATKDFKVKKLVYNPGSAYELFKKENERWKNSDEPMAKMIRELEEPKYKGFSIFGRLFVFWRTK